MISIFRLLTLFCFRFLNVRTVVLWLSRKIGRIYLWIRSEWRPAVLWLIVTALAVWLGEHFFNPKVEPWFQGSNTLTLSIIIQDVYTVIDGLWIQFWIIAALYALILILWGAFRARKRVVVEDFTDYTSDNASNQSKAIVKGLASLLVVRLSQLRDLYRNVDEQRAVPTSVSNSQSVDATIKVEDVSEFLKGAVSAQSKFSLGPLEIPVGTFLSLIGRLVQGPRIIGSLHRDGDHLVLTAQKMGGKETYSWRADAKIPHIQSEEQRTDIITAIVEELAYRMFTDLALSGSVRWRATSTFCEGLQAYRDCLRTPKDRKLNLKKAEKRFIETLADDQKFDMAYYNLGVVYTELQQYEAAEIVFSSAIKQNPGSWNAYYALALNRFERGEKSGAIKEDILAKTKVFSTKMDYESVIQLCKRVLNLKPGSANTAKAYQSRALAEARLGESNEAIRCLKKAIAYSWAALCKAELKGLGVPETGNTVIPPLETLASICLANLAKAYTQRANVYSERAARTGALNRSYFAYQRKHAFRRAEALLWQALRFRHSDPSYFANYYFQLGEMDDAWGKFEQAARAYKYAIRVQPERVEYRASLALAYARSYHTSTNKESDAAREDKEAALLACEEVLDCASEVIKTTPEVIEMAVEAYTLLGEEVHRERVKAMPAFLNKVEAYLNSGKLAIKDLEKMSANYSSEGRQIAVLLSRGLVLEKMIADYSGEGQEWECGQIFRALGLLNLDSNNFAKAEKYFNNAIKKLEGKHKEEIRIQRIRLYLAYSLLDQEGKKREAVQKMEEAVSFDSVSFKEREALGYVYFKLNEFEQAIDAWQDALLRRNALLQEPDEPDIQLNIGICYIKLAEHCREYAKRVVVYSEATRYLKQAFELYKSSEQEKKAMACYQLGLLHIELDKYWEAISYFGISQTLEFAPLTSIFWLGYALLRNKEYDECVKQFQSLLGKAEKRKKEWEEEGKTTDTVVETDTTNQMSLGEMLALACGFQAFAYAERDVNLPDSYAKRDANLPDALNLIRKAQEHLANLSQATTVHWSAFFPECEGWILYKLGKIDDAIQQLERAVSLTADPEIYLHLALAYERKLQDTKDKDVLQKAQIACQHVQELDINKRCELQVNDLLQRLQDKSQEIRLQGQEQPLLIIVNGKNPV